MAWLHAPEMCWGQLRRGSWRVRGRPRKEGVHPTLGAGLLAVSVLPTGWGRELTRHRMSFLVAGQCVHGSGHQGQGTDGLDATILCCCWEEDNHWFGSLTVVVRKGEKASLQGTGGLSLEECAGLDLGLISMALWDGTWLTWLSVSSITLLFQRPPSAVLPWC